MLGLSGTAAAHISSEVLDCAKELGIIVELLYAGMTAIMQPCDIWLNKAIKTIIKRLYYVHKNSLKLEPGQKVEVPREQIISWIEQAVHEVHADQRRTRKIAEIFYQCGLIPHGTKKIKFGAPPITIRRTPYTTYSLIQIRKKRTLLSFMSNF